MAGKEPSTSHELGLAYYRHEYDKEDYLRICAKIITTYNPNIDPYEAKVGAERALADMERVWGKRAENEPQTEGKSAAAS